MKIIYLLFFLLTSPLTGQIVVNSKLKQIYKASPGQKIVGSVQVTNSSEESCDCRFYTQDMVALVDGKYEYLEGGTLPRSASSWIKFHQDTIAIPSKVQGEVSYTLQVPQNNSLSGTYWTMILVEPHGKIKLPSQDGRFGIGTVYRTAIYLIVEIGDTGKYDVTLGMPEIKDNHFSVQVDNSGSRYVRLQPNLDLYDTKGKKIKEVKALPRLVFPGGAATFDYDLEQPIPGSYVGFVILEHTEDPSVLFGGKYPIEIKAKDVL
jgi:hypothetical protein